MRYASSHQFVKQHLKTSIIIQVGKHDAFEVPLQYVSQCNAGKNEVTLEFSLNEEAPVNLAEMR